MSNKEYIQAYKSSQQSVNSVQSPYEIVRSLMHQIIISMEKIVIDITNKHNQFDSKIEVSKKDLALKKSKNVSRCLSIIYGLQTSLDFDNAPEISGNLFQLYEYCRQQTIKGFSQNDIDGILKAISAMKDILDGWKQIPSEVRRG